jgi:hypothetical protein
MGFSLSWIAIRGRPTSEIFRELALWPTGERAIEGEAPFVGAQSASGWYLIVANEAEHPMLRPEILEPLSVGCEVMTCTVEEHVMFSRASGWKNGKSLWAVTHRGEVGPAGIEEEGTLPSEYAAIRDRLVQEQQAEGGANADVDYLFDIPVALVQAFVGYKHDELKTDFKEFEVLESDAGPTKKSWLGRLFTTK